MAHTTNDIIGEQIRATRTWSREAATKIEDIVDAHQMPPCPFKADLQKKRAHSRMKSQTTAPKPWSGGASSPSLRPSRKRLLFLNSPLRHAKSGTVQRFHKKTEGGTSTKKRGWPLKTTLLPTAFGSENTEDCLAKTGSVDNRKVYPHPLPPDTTRGWLLMH